MSDRQQSPILLVEDSPEDFEATRRAFRRAGLRNPMLHCATGDDALDFLYRRGRYAESTAPRPGIILLDLNLPGTDGREVLAEIKAEERLSEIPVVVLTTSADRARRRSLLPGRRQQLRAETGGPRGFMNAIQRLNDYWFDVVILPARVEPWRQPLPPHPDRRRQPRGPRVLPPAPRRGPGARVRVHRDRARGWRASICAGGICPTACCSTTGCPISTGWRS